MKFFNENKIFGNGDRQVSNPKAARGLCEWQNTHYDSEPKTRNVLYCCKYSEKQTKFRGHS